MLLDLYTKKGGGVYGHFRAQAEALSQWLANIKSRPLLVQQEGREAGQVCVDSGEA